MFVLRWFNYFYQTPEKGLDMQILRKNEENDVEEE